MAGVTLLGSGECRSHLYMALGAGQRQRGRVDAKIAKAIKRVLGDGVDVSSDNKREVVCFGSEGDVSDHNKITLGRVRYFEIPPLTELRERLTKVYGE